MKNIPVSKVHPELFHYTSADGIFGILESQCLWATHWKYLNDTRELHHFSERLPSLILPELIRRANELAETNELAKQYLADNGGAEEVCGEEGPTSCAHSSKPLLSPILATAE